MYNKLFAKIVDSSVWLEDHPTRIVWMTLMACMDQDGMCQFASVANLARRAIVTLEEAKRAVAKFEAPDEHSSDPDNDGRRVERVPGGWIVLNAKKYRDIVTANEQRRLARERAQRHRDKVKRESVTPQRDESGNSNGSVTQSEAYANADANEVKPPGSLFPEPAPDPKPKPQPQPAKVGKELSAWQRIVDAIDKAYRAANGAKCPWTQEAFAKLRREVDSKKTWGAGEWERCVSNRFASKNINRGEAPETFIPRLKDYIGGALNQYGHTGGHDGESHSGRSRIERIDDATATVIGRIRAGELRTQPGREANDLDNPEGPSHGPSNGRY